MEQGMTAIITADDVVRAGACREGVSEFVHEHAGLIKAAMPVEQVLKLVGVDHQDYVLKAADLNGYGSGSGYGYGYDYDDGSGSGYGSGYGDGDGQY
jgi:hypothetical protein